MRFLQLINDTRGATAIEYGLIVALIGLACIIAFQMLGLDLADVFTTVASGMA